MPTYHIALKNDRSPTTGIVADRYDIEGDFITFSTDSDGVVFLAPAASVSYVKKMAVDQAAERAKRFEFALHRIVESPGASVADLRNIARQAIIDG